MKSLFKMPKITVCGQRKQSPTTKAKISRSLTKNPMARKPKPMKKW